jgi:4a-hydroxytetrahydrobiopterin dehydratase
MLWPVGTVTRVADLANEHCQEYPPGTPPLSEAEAAELHRQVPAWEREGNRALWREFSFDDFGGAFGLVVRVALLAEAESHHPEIELAWGRAAFRTWTHTAHGLSRNDFVIAARIDLLAEA